MNPFAAMLAHLSRRTEVGFQSGRSKRKARANKRRMAAKSRRINRARAA